MTIPSDSKRVDDLLMSSSQQGAASARSTDPSPYCTPTPHSTSATYKPKLWQLPSSRLIHQSMHHFSLCECMKELDETARELHLEWGLNRRHCQEVGLLRCDASCLAWYVRIRGPSVDANATCSRDGVAGERSLYRWRACHRQVVKEAS